MDRVPVKPHVLRWARERSGIRYENLTRRFKKLPEWEEGKTSPTRKQLHSFADAVHVPYGYLFLREPPEESIPIPDFRTVEGQPVKKPSPNLLETIYVCEERQDWYREYMINSGRSHLDFVGTASIESSTKQVASAITDRLGFAPFELNEKATIDSSCSQFIRHIEEIGVLVMVSGVAGNNNHRRLDTKEFRGFALADDYAPLIFVNGTDAKVAQMFTLSHELAHIWLGESALSNVDVTVTNHGSRQEEVWCNKVAADFLVPLKVLRDKLHRNIDPSHQLDRLTSIFKVSKLVILRRLLDAQIIDRGFFNSAWASEMSHTATEKRVARGGGNFHRTVLTRASPTFARALVESTLEGNTLHRDALDMLELPKLETFKKFVDFLHKT